MSGIEASLSSGLLKVAGNKLVSLIASEFAAVTGVKKDLSELQNIHGEITCWLSAVRDLSIENDPRFGWVTKLKDVAYGIDDLLYEVHQEAEKHKIDNYDDKHSISNRFCAKPKSFLFRCRVAHKINAIKAMLAAITKQRSDMNAIWHNLPVNQATLSKNKATGAPSLLTNVEESQIPTRDMEKGEIICKLLESNKGEDGWIVSVVGLGGSGKTTLAKHICNDSKIKEHFKDKIFWVHVSEEFDVKKLFGKLFEAITKEKSDLHTPQHMVDEISRKLTGEKFLLVLDDCWHQDKEDWKEFMLNLRTHAAGSMIMITTRDQKVAEAVKSGHIFYLEYLSEAASWSLFLKSSGWEEEYLGSDFVQTGKEIVNKCGGVPLAIKTLGGVLSEKKEISTWRAIRQSDLWNEESTEGRVFASLKLSYIHLKDHLKQCFTFCCIFPKGCGINKNYLIEQWIAHGFIQQIMGEPPEVTGSEYFNSLVKDGFFQGPLQSRDGNPVVYKMHDLIHDLTRYILQTDLVTSLPENLTEDCAQKCRYLSLTSCYNNDERIVFDKVRALYVSKGNPSLEKLVKKSRYICSVVLDCALNTSFPLFILKLSNLGYLEIRKSMGKLKKLKTLEMISIKDLVTLPESIGDCRDLQSLQIRTCDKLREIPNTIGKNENLRLTRLRRLGLFVVGCGEDDARISDFGNLDMISGKIEFRDLQYVENPELAVLDALEPPSEITNLKIDGYRGSQIPCWMRKPSDSSYLEVVVEKQTRAPEFLCLTILILENFPNLKHMRGILVFPSLRSLYLINLPNLEELWTSSGLGIEEEEVVGERCCFPVLSDLGVKDCPKFTLSPCFPPLLESLELRSSNTQLLSPDSSFFHRHPNYADDEPSSSSRMIAWAPHLKRLKLDSMRGPSPGWEFLQHLTGLETLGICHCDLTELPESMRGLTSLRSLDISMCRALGVLPEWFGELRSLKSLEVKWCRRMSSLPQSIEHLTSLEILNIAGWVNLKQLPEAIQHLTSLQKLHLGGFRALIVLPEWIGQLSALRWLRIYNCPALQSLPSSIRRLTALQRLVIRRCPELARRCEKEVGDDWHLVSHIPSVNILDRLSILPVEYMALFCTNEEITYSTYRVLISVQAANYPGGKVLASFKTGDTAGLISPELGISAAKELQRQNKLPGLFVWSADSSKKSSYGFKYETQGQQIIANH
ncbi:hypothetical protein EJB05_28835, partial [Eragrostis curvula]